jgi:hypothetical protein
MDVSAMKGGEKLEAFLREKARKIKNAGTLKVGFLDGATYPDGTPVATVAAIQNFGAPAQGIPPRPFFSNMIRRYRETWPPAIAKGLKNTGMDAAKTLTLMGHVIASELQQQIIETTEPPLSPVTLMLRAMRKGDMDAPVTFAMLQEARRRVAAGETPNVTATGAKPLVYTGNLLHSVGFEINDDRYEFDEQARAFTLAESK